MLCMASRGYLETWAWLNPLLPILAPRMSRAIFGLVWWMKVDEGKDDWPLRACFAELKVGVLL
jgi:hypothetical protein